MPHDVSLIATIVAGLGLAFVFGVLAQRLRLSPLVGYLVAGIAIGPFTPGFVADQGLAPQLAEIGVILLMFGVGLHFSLADLMRVKAIAVPGAVGQIAIATVMGMGLAWSLGWTVGAGIVFGLSLSVASTVVLLRALQERRLIETDKGRIAVGWLIVEDLAMVLILVLLPAFSGLLGGRTDAAGGHGGGLASLVPTDSVAAIVGLTIAKVTAFVALMLLVGRRVIPFVLHYVAHTGSRELFRLAVLAIALGVAMGATELFGVSFALGAFFAGMVLAESPLSHQAAKETLPLRDAFAVLFFVSVGMLFDPSIVVRQPLALIGTVLVIVIGKSLAAFAIVRAFGRSSTTAYTISASLAQIGEFSFILAGLGVSLGLLPSEGRDLVLAGAIISILVNPLLFVLLDRMTEKEPAPAPADVPVQTALRDHVVLVGYGRVGRLVGASLRDVGMPYVVVEENEKQAGHAREDGVEVILGPINQPGIAAAAGLDHARWLVSAIPNPFEAGALFETARSANPALRLVARAHSDPEEDYLRKCGAEFIVVGEREIARELANHLTGTPEDSFEDARTTPPAEAGATPA